MGGEIKFRMTRLKVKLPIWKHGAPIGVLLLCNILFYDLFTFIDHSSEFYFSDLEKYRTAQGFFCNLHFPIVHVGLPSLDPILSVTFSLNHKRSFQWRRIKHTLLLWSAAEINGTVKCWVNSTFKTPENRHVIYLI